MVNKALVVENKLRQMDENKRKMNFQGQSLGSNTRPRLAPASGTQNQMRPMNQFRPLNSVQTPVQRSNYQAPRQAPPITPPSQGSGTGVPVGRKCFHCGQEGHYAFRCPQKQAQGPAQSQSRTANQAPPSGNKGPQNFIKGKVNHVIVEEA